MRNEERKNLGGSIPAVDATMPVFGVGTLMLFCFIPVWTLAVFEQMFRF